MIIVASVSCIYGLGSPESYSGMQVNVAEGLEIPRDDLLRHLVEIQYERNDIDFHRGTFRVRGDTVEIFPAYEEDRAVRIEFFGDVVEAISWVDPLRGKKLMKVDKMAVYPGSHYVTTRDNLVRAVKDIRVELKERLAWLKDQGKLLEVQRLEQRTSFDLEMMEEMGYCQGIENYSRHLTGRRPGEPPPTLVEYLPKDALIIVDESHATIPQLNGMYRGDRSRKETLVNHGFRLPSALDNRPLRFDEYEKFPQQRLYISATPAEYEIKKARDKLSNRSSGLRAYDPDSLSSPWRPGDDLLAESASGRTGERVLVTTLTKRMAST